MPFQEYDYITLGGTEFLDILDLAWIDRKLVLRVQSYETDAKRYQLAKQNELNLQTKGIAFHLVEGDIFDYQRQSCGKHIYFIDLEGTCRPKEYVPLFRNWFQQNIIRPNDFLLITSYLGRNPGWEKVLEPFDAEFRLLRLTSFVEKRKVYKRAHPLFVLHQALLKAGLEDELK
ncbi:MAG: hypothetical protein HY782_22710, partial [Chloroflexi bacterium]|nr:hypothetical protein [Chloroflexota bacterium]